MLKTVGSKSKFKVHWKVSPYDYSKENMNNIISKFSKKYNISKDRIKVEPKFISLNEKGEEVPITSTVIPNIQDPKFQLNLFKSYLNHNGIVDYDFSLIEKIDNEINAMVNMKVYDKYRRYSINWIKWSNFLSYGEDNYFDFTNLKGLILLNGEPANQSGKTTFAIDLVHFLLFGKTDKSATQDKIFNKHLPEATKVYVEGSITIDGVEYIIKRELKRTSFDKRTSASRTTQKIWYYKVVLDGSLEELEEYVENQTEESNKLTNKVIKDAIGNESDFDMIICATSSNLDELIEKKDSERGRLLSRWIGLLPIEEKDIVARDIFNSTIKKSLLSNYYNSEQLKQEIEALTLRNNALENDNNKLKSSLISLEKDIESLENTKKVLFESKKEINEDVLKIDITTLKRKIENLISDGKNNRNQLSSVNEELSKYIDLEFLNEEYDNIVKELNKISTDIELQRQTCIFLKKEIKNLEEEEYCPLCKRKFDNINNTDLINEKKIEYDKSIEKGKVMSMKHKELEEKVLSLKTDRENFNLKNTLTVKKSVLETKIEKLKNEYLEAKSTLDLYNQNTEAIDKNNKLDIEIRNNDFRLNDLKNTKDTTIRTIERNCEEIKNNTSFINERNDIINKIIEETKLVKHWKIYLDMIGKNGICKMVLRKTLPIINAQIMNLLHDICDFSVDIDITDKNEVMFYLIKDGVRSDLTSGSGFEKTASALALRYVLGNISTLPKNNGLILDEVWGRIAKENYDNIKKLLDKMLQTYDYIFIITHLDEVKEYCDKIVTVTKINDISRINVIK